MTRTSYDELTPREREEFEQQKELVEMQGGYTLKRTEYEIELQKIQAKWTNLLRLPFAIILLPVKLVMAFALPISVITKKDLPEAYWEFLKG
jgi:hypothetical protein